jgi:cytochrome c
MSAWLDAPTKYVPGTKMTFAGLSKPQDRANVIAYMNAQGSNLPLPPPPAASAAVAAAEKSDAPASADKAENEPVLNEAQVAKQPEGNVGGEGAPSVTGRAGQERR